MINEILIEQTNVSDDQYKLVDLKIKTGVKVKKGDDILTYESSKIAFNYEAQENGFLYINPCIEIGEFYAVGFKLAIISSESLLESNLEKIFGTLEKPIVTDQESAKITQKASMLIRENNIDLSSFEGLSHITEKHVRDFLNKENKTTIEFNENPERESRLKDLRKDLDYARNKIRYEFKRHIPTGTVLNDRWELAKSFKWGSGSSVYDESLILGEVILGDNCWVGPFTILDGNAFPITIGEWTSIGSGTHVYTHHTIDQALSGGKIKSKTAPVSIGKCCFISPQVIVAPGTKIGDFCFVTAQTYVEGSFPDYSIISGNPGKLVGKIEIKNKVIRKVFFNKN